METRTYTSKQEESVIIERVARIVSSVRGTKPDYTRLAAELEPAIPFDVFGVVLLRHDRQAVRVAVCHREGTSWRAAYHQHPLAGSMFERVLTAPALMVNDYPDGLDGLPVASGDALSGSPQLHSTLIAPLMVEDRVLGTLELGSLVYNQYADKTLQRLVSAVAGVLASAIESVQLGGSAAIQDRQRQVLKDVTSALTSKIDLSTILDQIVGGIANALNVAAVIIMLDRENGALSLQAQAGLDPVTLESVFHRNLLINDKNIIGQTLQRRQPIVSQDIASDEDYPESSIFFTELGMHSIFSYPLVTGSTVFGALLLCSPEPGGFTPLKADIFSLFASQATVAIHNGMLLESAHQRSRFQDAIEQFEKVHSQRIVNDEVEGTQRIAEAPLLEELELFATVRDETLRTFGINFSSLLRFISDHLLTQNERNLQAMISSYQAEHTLETGGMPLAGPSTGVRFASRLRDERFPGQQNTFADTLSLLTQMAETALARTGIVGELSRLIIQLKQSTDGVKDAWFVVDLNGICVYMNPAAESLCKLRMGDVATVYDAQFQIQSTSTTIEDVFAKLLPRFRNIDEAQLYLQAFTQESFYRQELRCALAVETVYPLSTLHESVQTYSPQKVESAPSDYHYQLIRHPLCNQDGVLVANALQACDVTEQVRDEKNRSALLSSVSHDLRTPLTTIKAAVTGLLQEDVAWNEEDRRAMLEDIDSEADHLTVQVNALVELSRIEMGALVLEKEWCDGVEVVYGTIAKMKRVLADRPVHVASPPHFPLVYADHAQLERVFYNLLENAALHSPIHTEITVKLDVADDMFHARVIDRGSGVPEYERERIFTSFYSLRSYGNALGLAICKGIIAAHQGNIWVEAGSNTTSGEAVGACYVFTLPLQPQSSLHVTQHATTLSKSRRKLEDKGNSSQQVHKPLGEE